MPVVLIVQVSRSRKAHIQCLYSTNRLTKCSRFKEGALANHGQGEGLRGGDGDELSEGMEEGGRGESRQEEQVAHFLRSVVKNNT